MLLVVKSGGQEAMPEWQSLYRALLPELEVVGWDDPALDPARVEYAMVWEPTPGRLAQFPALRVIMSSAAGVDHITRDPSVPAHLPITRMVTPETEERMADFVTAASYGIVRDFPMLREAQKERRWDESIVGRRASETTVAILGLGNLGAACARRLAANGFRVKGWARTHKQIERCESFAGDERLGECVSDAHIVVNLLPDTAATRGLIGNRFLEALPRGASLINVGRAPQVDLRAVVESLDTGHLRSAFIDVFDSEPLSPDDQMWNHPKLWVSSHIASAVSRKSKARQIVKNILADRSGQPLEHVYTANLGY
ncbi:glyoxylate/hydroxypyruvate reductase A [Paraburkholderia sp. J63]|uniref:2-hydroxyacid dehydrogenase n=1 Tax=Paraburkholderia sp. J63 TaxID=2805434 RepID=UPI002ABD684E|nr:glyoxylate/hydroxypyruvate reductase A [Paraburkholderia sp. J63]